MSERTKVLHTKNTDIHRIEPEINRPHAIHALENLGYPEIRESIPFEDTFPDHHPCRNIAGYRHQENLTQKLLSELTRIPQSHISAMENNNRPIGRKNAKIIAKGLNANYRMFLSKPR
ncbi:MAG: XRE family transcriptional regulator [Candidatus Omnitrophota bacterium]|nr:MAG: XRE family transcriptional regulator [Candidatus Omnitrophota bacterium]